MRCGSCGSIDYYRQLFYNIANLKAYFLNIPNYTIIKLILYRVGLIYHVQIDTEFQLLTQASSNPNLDREGIHDQQEHLLQ